MAASKKIESAPEPAMAATNGDAPLNLRGADRPIVLELKSNKKKKKKGTSKQLRDMQRTEAKLAKVSERAAKAVAKGAEAYNDARKKSVSNKRDGAMRDFGGNLAYGLSEAIRESSAIPVQLADAMDTRMGRRFMRFQLRMARNGLRLWRF